MDALEFRDAVVLIDCEYQMGHLTAEHAMIQIAELVGDEQ